MSNNTNIAKNTLFLYVRMLFIMVVSLFTSRVVLDKLGVVDYGIYGAIGGVVGMLGFLNGTLSTGTSRFLTFEIGAKNYEKLKATFCTAFYTHLLLAIMIAILLETGGLWFLYNKLIIPEERLFSAEIVLHISILTTFINITQVPYTSTIIAHENMRIYAYMGILEAILKLSIVYLLTLSNFDRLIFYASLLALVQICIALSYRMTCISKYKEAHLFFVFDRRIFSDMMKYSSWNLFANISQVLSVQGLVTLIGMFFTPAVVAAQTIATQVGTAFQSFASNVYTAVNPQIIKHYAAGEFEVFKKITQESATYIFDLMLLIGLPLISVMRPLMELWLVDVPDFAVCFTQYIMVSSIINFWTGTYYSAMMASGELKWNAIAGIGLSVISFVILYFLLGSGVSVIWVQRISVVQATLTSIVLRPFILYKKIGFEGKELIHSIIIALKHIIMPVLVFIVVISSIPECGFFYISLRITLIVCSVIISVYFNLDKDVKSKFLNGIHKKLQK